MPVTIVRLRRWFAVAAMAAVLCVSGAYFYARHRVQNALKQVPGKIGADIRQSAQGYTYSQSQQGRTLFKIQAAKALFKLDGRAQLQDVAITLYGKDAGRFDQIYGSDFEYDPQSGDVTAHGRVQIDLEANPAGVTSPDQTPPKELKDPIHLETSGLVFNQKTGDAHTKEKVDFRISQAHGSAMGVSYVSKSDNLTFDSQVEIALAGTSPTTVTASHGTITKDPRVVMLQTVHMQQKGRSGQADAATLFLRPDDTLDHILAEGNVQVEIEGKQPTRLHAGELELLLNQEGSQLRTATFSQGVAMESAGSSPAKGSAGRVVASFSSDSVLSHVLAEQNVRLTQPQHPSAGNRAQSYELDADAVNFFVAEGKRLTKAETSGPAQFEVEPAVANGGTTIITADQFAAQFDALGQLAAVHGAPGTRIVSRNPGEPDRVSTSVSVDASFAPGQGMETAVQQGNVVFAEGARKAWAEHARYTPSSQTLELSGSPRVVDENMTTTCRIFRVNRATGEGFAEGEVKSTYNDLKPQPSGALLASSSPIHVTASTMTIHRTPAVALYSGGARLWQDDNVVAAPTIEFDRNHRSIVATGTASQPVSTILMQTGKHGRALPTAISAALLTYVDNERKAHYSGGVTAKSADFTLTSRQMDVFLQARNPQGAPAGEPAGHAGEAEKLDRIVAQGQVVVTQPQRRATGDQLVYTTADEKLVLTGGPPSTFDAERGKITGVSLTLFRGDDRVLVEGTDTSPSVTQTRVAR